MCELNGDIIDCAVPGDVVSVTGVVKPLLSKEGFYPPHPNFAILYLINIPTKKITGNRRPVVFTTYI